VRRRRVMNAPAAFLRELSSYFQVCFVENPVHCRNGSEKSVGDNA
jgi:hypothetical protein